MAAASTQEASTSSSSSSSGNAYHVFLSFRGTGNGMGFSDLLYAALEQAGFHTFRGHDAMDLEIIDEELQKAMQESKLYIVVFSEEYASSLWCLNELVKIMELKAASKKIVVPVFYDADPSDVWDQGGSFAEAFSRHEELFRDKVGRWRKALRDVAELAGMISQDGYEAKFIEDIVKMVGNKLKNTPLSVPLHLVGIESRVKDINQWLQDTSNEVGIAMIYGIGGIGKTTIAKAVYNLNLDKFEGCCFLANVRETSEEPEGQIFLQKQLLEKIVSGKKRKINNEDEGAVEIKDAINCKRVLIVFDDVDQYDQITAIIGMWDWLYQGSKIIITSRHEKLLKAHEKCKKFRVKELDVGESLELFSWHAFGHPRPFEGYIDYSAYIVDYCCGLPLALEVLGRSFSAKNEYEWGEALEKLKRICNSEIQKALRISYDSLQDDHEKNLFLHIACFFIGYDEDFVIAILDGCGFSTKAGIQNLIDRHLISINEANKLTMNRLLRDMGREIVRQESPDEPGKRSRLWFHEDALTVLREKSGTEAIKGLVLSRCNTVENEHSKFSDINCTQQHYHQDLEYNSTRKRRCFGFFSWRPVAISLTSFPILNEVDIEMKAFAKMPKLKLLQLEDIRFSGGYENFPRNLVWLSWHGFPLKLIPSNLCLEKLVVLDMRRSSLKHVWSRTTILMELKILNLSHSHGLVSTPDFSGLPNLEQLILKDCLNLVEVHESIGDLERLVLLNLKDCKRLKKLPKNIVMSKSLENLILSGCLKLDGLPEELSKVESLMILHADGIAIKQSSLATTSWLSTFCSCFLLRKTEPPSFSFAFLPNSLLHLSFGNCNISDDLILENLGSFSSLRYLNFSGNPIRSLPESINALAMLESLLLDHCYRLQSIPELPITLKELRAEKCTSLERVANLPNLFKTLKLLLVGCEHLVEVRGLFKLEPISNLDRDLVDGLGFINLESLSSIKVKMFNHMTMTTRITTPQVLHECGIRSIFLEWSEIPSCCSHQIEGSSLYFEVPSLCNREIIGMSICIIYSSTGLEDVLVNHQYINISNNTKRIKWTYSPTFHEIPEENKDMLWISHWNLKDLLDAGDHLKISVVMSSGYQVKHCGIHVVHKQEEEDASLNHEEKVQIDSPCCQTISDVDVQMYRVGEAAFFLCNHDYLTHQKISECGEEDKLKLYPFLFEQ